MQALWSARRAIFSLALLILVGALAAVIVRNLAPAHASDPASVSGPAPTLHRAFYRTIQVPPSQWTVRVGQQVDLLWMSEPDSQISYRPIPIFCVFALYGVFPTEAAAEQAGNQLPSFSFDTPPASTLAPVFTAPQLTVDTWDEQLRTSSFMMPLTLKSGYYIWIASARIGAGPDGTDASGIVQVSAPAS